VVEGFTRVSLARRRSRPGAHALLRCGPSIAPGHCEAGSAPSSEEEAPALRLRVTELERASCMWTAAELGDADGAPRLDIPLARLARGGAGCRDPARARSRRRRGCRLRRLWRPQGPCASGRTRDRKGRSGWAIDRRHRPGRASRSRTRRPRYWRSPSAVCGPLVSGLSPLFVRRLDAQPGWCAASCSARRHRRTDAGRDRAQRRLGGAARRPTLGTVDAVAAAGGDARRADYHHGATARRHSRL
jgi:hypothetical protein